MPVIDPEFRNADRLNRAINYAHAHIQKDVQLDQLADVACMSKYHFARIFHDQVGETPISFLKRIRLERATSMLRSEGPVSIKEIAWQCGFASNQLFSRNFRRWSGQTASEIRTGYLNQLREKAGQASSPRPQSNPTPQTNEAEIDIIRLSPTRVAYVRSFGQYGDCPHIDQAFDLIQDWAEDEKLSGTDPDIIGISWDFPAITPSGRCRFDACLPLPPEYESRSGISQQTIPGGLYATTHFTFRQMEDLNAIWKWFLATLNNARKFDRFTVKFNIGPWFEKLRIAKAGEAHSVRLFAPLVLREVRS